MLIDWFTLAAQILNFLVLVWLLKRFLWTRLIQAIDDRENRIAARLADADLKDKQAIQRMEELDAGAAGVVREQREALAQARREADELRLEMTRKAREDVRRQEANWREDLEREKSAFLDDVRQRMGVELLAVIRRALTDLACADIQHCATEVFLERLQNADLSSLRELAKGGTITVLSASDFSEEMKRRIEEVLTARLGQAVRLKFDRHPAMSWGVELRSNGRAIGWTPDSYLESLDSSLRKALEARPKALVG